MKLFLYSAAFASALCGVTTAALAGDLKQADVKTHPSQGEVATVADATARLAVSHDGVFVNIDTSALAPDHVHTLWLVVINDPAACETTPCSSKDVLKRTATVKADVGYAGGLITDGDGQASFAAFQPIGPMRNAWFTDGLPETEGVEVHLVVNDHGPAISGRTAGMLSTYRGGCTNESIPAPMPETARAQGTPGPNACRLVQFAIFTPENAPS